MSLLDKLFESDEQKNFYGEIISVRGSRYTLKDQQGRTVYAYSNLTYKLGQWVLSEGGTIVQSVNRPETIKVYEV